MTTDSWAIAPRRSQTAADPIELVYAQLIGGFGHKRILDLSSTAVAYKQAEQTDANNVLRPACLNIDPASVSPDERERQVRQDLEERLSRGESFEAIVSVGLIEQLAAPLTFLKLVDRLRAPGGAIAIAVAAAHAADRLPPNADDRLATIKLIAEGAAGPASDWCSVSSVEGVVLAPSGAQSPPDVDHTAWRTAEGAEVLGWIGFWGEPPVRRNLLIYRSAPAPSRVNDLAERLRQSRADTCRLEAALAEERRVSLSLRQKLNAPTPRDEIQSSEVHISPDSIRRIAMEVWFEKQRWGLPYKILKMLKGRTN